MKKKFYFSTKVPAQMSNDQFWSRYFFKYNQLEEDYKKRLQLLEKASKTETSNEETNDWEDGKLGLWELSESNLGHHKNTFQKNRRQKPKHLKIQLKPPNLMNRPLKKITRNRKSLNPPRLNQPKKVYDHSIRGIKG